ncbi:unnamed protein product [Clonostachys rosea]|uniref:Letm1 RBD domain-containing protein n=1 Tax=Bionectria ochroleuca TaxID=29856 RepID=A0ABY6V140_BIOOC|nr:unnamed protein product [Clonostachys rosea]
MISRSQARIVSSGAIAPLRHCIPNSSRLLGVRPFANVPAGKTILQLQSPSQVRYSSHDARSRRTQLTKKPENAKLNPPAQCRPPPINIPIREAYEQAIKYYIALGKAYLYFFKDGFKNVLANRRLLADRLKSTPKEDHPSIFKPHHVPRTFSRADWVLFWRVRHDMIRLPAFGLLLLIAGEMSPFVILVLSGLVPLPCRPPMLTSRHLEKAEARRKIAFEQFEAKAPAGALTAGLSKHAARNHVLRSLYLSGAPWEHLQFMPPGMWQAKGYWRLAFLEGDDKKLIEDGGITGLIKEELRIACMERGINVLGKSETDMKAALGDWLRLTADEDINERRKRMTVLLLTRQKNWPQTRNFALPSWHL